MLLETLSILTTPTPFAKAVANASNDVLCHDTCSSHVTDHTSSTSTIASTTEADLKQLKDKNKNKNTIKSTVTWINRFEAWRKARGINNELEIYQRTS